MQPFDVLTTFGKVVRIFDKVIVAQDVRKFEKNEALRYGFNYRDGENRLGDIPVTRYMATVCQPETIYDGQVREVGTVILLNPIHVLKHLE